MVESALRRLLRLFATPIADPLVGAAGARLIVGLGNPGPEYARTRHNIGFLIVEEIARRRNARWQAVDDVQSLVAVDTSVVLARPQTYMNRSGTAVRQLIQRLDVPSAACLIVYDDMDLPFGTLRLRQRGSAGTHNGMRSVVAELGSQDVPRLRIGISQAARPGQAVDHVLGDFSDDEQPALEQLIGRAADAALTWLNDGAEVAMNRYNN
jgi:PTH1 family peptidyl-tRNA hydrolase